MEESRTSERETSFVQIEVVPTGPRQPGFKQVGREEEILNMAKKDFEIAMKGVAEVANTVKRDLSDLKAQHVAVAFGVKLTGGVNFMITAGLEANFNVTVTWDDNAHSTAD